MLVDIPSGSMLPVRFRIIDGRDRA